MASRITPYNRVWKGDCEYDPTFTGGICSPIENTVLEKANFEKLSDRSAASGPLRMILPEQRQDYAKQRSLHP